ncbi:general substrate transporter [Dactylonectria macrodidyma]|uniref:General substrate transporter n=1 Tax=Dactylonectria macrodidyma TaxID=307937 RepID=A0A9P9F196_9HYPO|nr:general substrate transporter [Dactylonectria macrodidyma]
MGSEYAELASIASRPNSLDEAPSQGYEASSSTKRAAKRPNGLDEKLTIWKAFRKFPKVTGYCLAMSIAIIGLGYGLVIMGAITGLDTVKQDYGKKHNGKQIIPQPYVSLWTALTPAGGAIGAILGGWLQGRIGRKFTFMIGSIFYATGVTLVFFSHYSDAQNSKRIVLTGGVAILGFAIAMIQTTANTYLSEIAPTSLRGPAMAMIPTFTLLGQLLGSTVVFLVQDIPGKRSYLTAFGSQWIFPAATFLLSCIMPDSPIHLARMGHNAKALRAAKRLYSPKVNEYAALETFRITIGEEAVIGAKASYAACFRGTNLRRTMIVILASVMPAMFGLDLLSTAAYFLETIGMEEPINLLFLIGGIVAGMLANAAGIWVLSRMGMRNMTIVSMGIAGCLWAVMGVSGIWKGDVPLYVAAGILIAVIVVCGLGCWPASYAYIGQTSSLQLRALTQGLVGVSSQGASVCLAAVIPVIYNPDSGNLGAKVGFLYMALCIIATILAWLFLPEMKGRSVIEVDQMFEIKLSTKNFRYYKLVSDEDREEGRFLAQS